MEKDAEGTAWGQRRHGGREGVRDDPIRGTSRSLSRLRAFERIRDEQTNTASPFSKKKRRWPC